jgi:hypothetical protein
MQKIPMNQHHNQPIYGTLTGTALALFMQITNAEILKTSILAAIGAAVSFLVSHFIKVFLKWINKK